MKYSGKIIKLLEKMTLEEKVLLLSGAGEWETHSIERLGIPSVICSDGPSGVRRQAGKGDHLGLNASLPATCFPSAATVANSWDEALAEKVGQALGEEAASLGVDILLGPGLNIKRSPLCGRNFEYFSEDPYLAGKMAAGYIRGIQSTGTSACPKHFAVNSQEERRMAMNAVVDERTLREIYLTGFEIAVKEGQAKSLMTSYNEVNGVYANENRHLLQDILREEWGYDGLVITDWGGSNNHTAGVQANSNLEMPCPGYDSAIQLVKAYHENKITMGEIDDCVGTYLENLLSLKEGASEVKKELDVEGHHAIAREAAEKSIVLLKNEGKLLPLKEGIKAVVIGDFAAAARYQGAGSSNVNCTRLENICDLIQDYPVEYAGYARGYARNSGRIEKLEAEAVKLAERAEVILYFFGLDEISESEGLDRKHLRIPQNQIALLKELQKTGVPIVGILEGGAAIEMPWEEDCKAMVHAYLGGQAGASAILDTLVGKVNPAGRLNESYPISYEDTPAREYFPAKQRNAEYREGIFVGYRYYDAAEVPVRYAFGHGLSYTTFEYSSLEAGDTEVSFTITNTGDRDGEEVAQVYIGGCSDAVFRAKKELKGFRRIFLKAGESRRLTIPLDDKAFRYWNVKTNRWEVETADYRLQVGAASDDIRLTGTISVKGTDAAAPYQKEEMPSYWSGKISHVTDQEYEKLLGTSIPEEHSGRSLTMNDAFCQMRHARSPLCRLIFWILERIRVSSEKKGKPNLNVLFIYNMPFRGMAKMTGGAVNMKMAEGMVKIANWHFFTGLGTILYGFVCNIRDTGRFKKDLASAARNNP